MSAHECACSQEGGQAVICRLRDLRATAVRHRLLPGADQFLQFGTHSRRLGRRRTRAESPSSHSVQHAGRQYGQTRSPQPHRWAASACRGGRIVAAYGRSSPVKGRSNPVFVKRLRCQHCHASCTQSLPGTTLHPDAYQLPLRRFAGSSSFQRVCAALICTATCPAPHRGR